jgi:heparosan-N-sulfate-glucuronate 5-epimerase
VKFRFTAESRTETQTFLAGDRATTASSRKMTPFSRLHYYHRVLSAYSSPGRSQLAFWHDSPEVNERSDTKKLGEYYMPFGQKADYSGPYDQNGIPMLNYFGRIGLQYNPIAIAQYGLGNYNLYRRTGDATRKQSFLRAADWLLETLRTNSAGVYVWNHNFDWEYRTTLKAPWYSGLAQGQGISLLVRAHAETNESRYLDGAEKAFCAFRATIDKGGVSWVDGQGGIWFEEYIVSPPSHILNGFIWATWGVFDYYLSTGDSFAFNLFSKASETIARNLGCYDVGFWSLYEQASNGARMLASSFYHSLHVIQLRIQHRLTADDAFRAFATRWDSYRRSRFNRNRAFLHKAVFKILHY